MARSWRSFAVATTVAAVLVGCSGSNDDAEAATIVCNELRSYNDDVVDAVNASVADIASVSPERRRPAIAAGLDEVTALVAAWRSHIADIDLPDLVEAAELRSQMVAGADAALDELADEHGHQLAATGPIVDDEVQGAVGQWFNAVEKAVSVSEPKIFTFERRNFKQAFLDEPACRNVIQQFRNGE